MLTIRLDEEIIWFSKDIYACVTSVNRAKVIIGNWKNIKDAPLKRDLIKDTLSLVEDEENKSQVDSSSGPVDDKTVALTTWPPPLPISKVSYHPSLACDLPFL